MRHCTKHTHLLAVIVLTVGLTAGAQAQDADDLLADLSGDDATARREAWQNASELGAEAVEPLCELYAGDDPATSRAARLALEALVTAQSAPDADEREAVSEALLNFMGDADAPTDRLRYAMRLVSWCGGDEAVGPMAALLGDEDLGEQARQTLCRIPGAAATEALIVALKDADGDAAVPFANALGTRRDPVAVDALIAVVESGTPTARAAALGALGRIGDPAGAPTVEQQAKAGQGEVQAAAVDALLRLAGARMADDEDAARGLYESALQCGQTANLKIAALVGIRAIGDPASLPIVLASVGGTDRVLLQSTLASVSELAGDDVVVTLQDAYATASPEAKGLLLQGIALEAGEDAAPLLIEALGSAEPAVQIAAATALNRQVVAGAAEPLLAVAESGSDEVKPIALAAYLKILQAKPAGQSRAFAHALEIATQDGERRSALAGLALDALPEDYDLVEPLTRNDGTRQAALTAHLGVGLALVDADEAKATEVLSQVIQRGANRDLANRAAQALRGLGVEVDLAREAGFVVDWWIVGPLPKTGDFRSSAPLADAGDVDVTEGFTVDKVTLPWVQAHTDDVQGMYDFDAVLGHTEDCMVFAVAKVRSEAARDVVLRMGSDDGIVCWVNGELVHANDAARPVGVDQDSANAHLEADENTLLLKITQGGGGWGYCLRITDDDGLPVLVEVIE